VDRAHRDHEAQAIRRGDFAAAQAWARAIRLCAATSVALAAIKVSSRT